MQTSGWGRKEQGGTLFAIGQHCTPDCRHSFVFEAKASKGELPFVNAAEQFDAGNRSSGGSEGFEAEHRPGSRLDPAMVLLDDIIQILGGAQLRALGQQSILTHLANCSMGRRIAVEGDRIWPSSLVPHRLLEEGLGCGYIACRAEPEVDRLPGPVHSSIKVAPAASDLDIGLIDTPGAARDPTKAVPSLDELRYIPLHPAQDGRMGKVKSARPDRGS